MRENQTVGKTVVVVTDAMAVLQAISGLGIQPRSIEEAIGAADNIRRLYGAVAICKTLCSWLLRTAA